MSSEQQSSYRQIMKATSLFGGVQVFQILIQIIRSKFVALYLGPAGMGIVGLLYSTMGLIANVSNLGISTSAVKDVAEANEKGDTKLISTKIKVLRQLMWFTGILGAIFTFIFATWLSKITFGNTNYDYAFYWLSITLIFNQINIGELAVLQGMRKLKLLAKANLFVAFSTLAIAIPLYYYLGKQGIVPVYLLTALLTLIFTLFFSTKINLEKVKVNKAITIDHGKNMIKMGFMISLSGFMTMAVAYFVRVYIAQYGTIADVGLYNAGFTIITTYVGMVFTAMGTDYYPRLASVAHDYNLTNETINQQSEIALLILAPILMLFIIFIDWAIILLYSTEFTAISTMVQWAAIGMFFRAASWAIGFIFLAKGDSKFFFWNELFSNLYVLLLNLFGYYLGGLNGLGVAFLLSYILHLAQMIFFSRRKYSFIYNKTFVRIFVLLLAIAILCFIFVRYLPTTYAYIAGMLCITYTTWYSYKELDKRLDIKMIIKQIMKK